MARSPSSTCRAGVKEAADTSYGGYAGYFRGPDEHLWEIVWNPANIPSG
jgi:predicted lactoylglutathione lyase